MKKALAAAPIICLALLLCASACKDSKDAGEGSTSEGAAESYSVRGKFMAFDSEAKRVSIHHESIPEFVNRQGKKAGMMAMEMSFRIADGVDFSSYKSGDKLKFSFTVEWKESPPIKVLSAEKLPADTKLNL